MAWHKIELRNGCLMNTIPGKTATVARVSPASSQFPLVLYINFIAKPGQTLKPDTKGTGGNKTGQFNGNGYYAYILSLLTLTIVMCPGHV